VESSVKFRLKMTVSRIRSGSVQSGELSQFLKNFDRVNTRVLSVGFVRTVQQSEMSQIGRGDFQNLFRSERKSMYTGRLTSTT
jgi:hypothetical protein